MWHCLLCCTKWSKFFSLWIKPYCVTIQIEAIEQYFHVVLFIILYDVSLHVSLHVAAAAD